MRGYDDDFPNKNQMDKWEVWCIAKYCKKHKDHDVIVYDKVNIESDLE